MTDINKQKFLNELSRLLTFMYEEDRQLALSMYSDAFDSCEDMQGLIASLVSPTRQAVIIARAYDAKERKLQIYAQPKGEDDIAAQSGEIPGFVSAIEAVLPEITASGEEEGQFSLFADDEEAPAQEPAEEEVTEEPAEQVQEAPAAEEVPAAEASEEAQEEDPEEVPAEEEAAKSEIEAAAPAESEKSEEVSEDEEESEEDEGEEDEDHKDDESEDSDADSDDEDEEEEDDDEDEEDKFSEPVVKANIPLLILYIIFSVPLGILGIAALLIPTAICLAVACAAIYGGSAILVATFSGFAVFADIMVMLGLALIVLSFGLLFLWFFIWFIGGAMANLARGLVALGRKWCYKEVRA